MKRMGMDKGSLGMFMVALSCQSVVAQGKKGEINEELNLAYPSKYSYADTKGGRDGLLLDGEKINEYRLYNFYERQADYYLAHPEKMPKVLPASPGLDGGEHGHWGKYADNVFVRDVWSKMDMGRVASMYAFAAQKFAIPRAVTVKTKGGMTAFFDEETLSYPAVWTGENVIINPKRFGILKGLESPEQVDWVTAPDLKRNRVLPEEIEHQYKGYYRVGDVPVFSYEVNGADVLEVPSSKDGVFVRTLEVVESTSSSKLSTALVAYGQKDKPVLKKLDSNSGSTLWAVENGEDIFLVNYKGDGEASLEVLPNSQVVIELALIKGSKIEVATTKASKDKLADGKVRLAAAKSEIRPSVLAKKKDGQLWTETVSLKGTVAKNTAAYVGDELPVPFQNPWNSVMFLSGVEFLSNGNAFVSTLTGDIWHVSGIDEKLEKVVWKRYASGLCKPFGLKVIDDKLYVGCHNSIVKLHDYDGDLEADFYECFDARWPSSADHSKSYGLDSDDKGNFYVMGSNITRKLPMDGGKPVDIGSGTRSAMGFGASPAGKVLIAPQEGGWTPASMIIETKEGEHYGWNTKDGKVNHPLCFLPRTIDNSTGGFVWIDSKKWGPLSDQFVCLSYGNGTMFPIIYKESKGHNYAGITPMKPEFRSGVVRGRVSPKDGQLYVAGCDGWGNYSIDPGCFSRVRYTGAAYDQPTDFEVFSNGIRLDFEHAVAHSAEDLKAFCQQWNYEYSYSYGSQEYSIRESKTLGHDNVKVKSVSVVGDGKSVFVELPGIAPAMQFHVRLHYKTAEGRKTHSSLYTTIHQLDKKFDIDKGGVEEVDDAKTLALRVRFSKDAKHTSTFYTKERVRKSVNIHSKEGEFAFYPKAFTVKAGQVVRLTYSNNCTYMPHNLVITTKKGKIKVGENADKIAPFPESLKNHYVPQMDEVLFSTHLVNPLGSHKVYFQAPEEPGEYPFICTYPGHWRVMQGVMTVVK